MASDVFNYIIRQMWMQQNESHSLIYFILTDFRNDLKKLAYSASHSDSSFLSWMYTASDFH